MGTVEVICIWAIWLLLPTEYYPPLPHARSMNRSRRQLTLTLLATPVIAVAARRRDQPKCIRLREQMSAIDRRLRQPYRAKQGRRLKERRWRMKLRYSKECR